jgi:hypothetical protein
LCIATPGCRGWGFDLSVVSFPARKLEGKRW